MVLYGITGLHMESQKRILGHLAALFTVTVWGITFISTKILLEDFNPVEIMFYRLCLAAVALSIVSPPRGVGDLFGGGWKMAAAGLCGVTLFFLFQNLALSYTLAANVSVLVSAAPLLTALVSRVVLREKLRAGFYLGFWLAMAGIVLIGYNGSFVLHLNPLGDLLSLLAALAWAFYGVLIVQIGAKDGGTLPATRKVITYGLLFTLPVLPWFDFRAGVERLGASSNLLHLVFLGVIASAVCYVSWNYAVGRLGAARTSVYIYLVPMAAIVVSALALGERVTLVGMAGMGLILGGMALSERAG